jgi:lipopolysaccharide/colanic/teichoic acid biosynthesis glycosyltransferase
MKRCVDLVGSIVGLFLLAVPLFIVACIVRIGIGSPVFFSQLRPGMHCKPFRMYKFRSMSYERGPDGALLPDSARLTPVGNFIRATSLDELPGLWNVVKGDMSLVGPRPLLLEYVSLYTPEQRRRHEVRPGITGWAQVNGRNALTWEQKFELDVWYVDHRSFLLDLKILLMTVRKVFVREGISARGEATMPRFTGTR